jgi:hypothetical protein
MKKGINSAFFGLSFTLAYVFHSMGHFHLVFYLILFYLILFAYCFAVVERTHSFVSLIPYFFFFLSTTDNITIVTGRFILYGERSPLLVQS